MRRARLLPAIAAAILLAGCQPSVLPAPVERIWEGRILIRGFEEVPAGDSLVIRPGTRVIFSFSDRDGDGLGNAGILVRGKIIARGNKDAPIIFEAEKGDNSPGRWAGVRIESGEPSRFQHCIFQGAGWAIHAHYTPLRVEANLFTNNVGGVKFRGGPVEIFSNDFSENGTAIRYWESDPEIISNLFRDNGTAIFCREGSMNTILRGNNFFRSSDYHIKLGELQTVDIDARFNHWGTADLREVEETIFDKRDVEYLGQVIIDPPELKPFPLGEEGGGQ